MEDGEAQHKELTPYRRSVEVSRAQRALEHLIRLHERDGKLPEPDGHELTPLDMEEAKAALTELKATDVAALMLTSNAPPEIAHVAHNRARRALYALAPVVHAAGRQAGRRTSSRLGENPGGSGKGIGSPCTRCSGG